MILLGAHSAATGTALSTLANTSQQLVSEAMKNMEDSRSEKSSLCSSGSASLLDRELECHEMRIERRRLVKAGFIDEARQFDPKIEFFRVQKIKAKERKERDLLESKIKSLKMRQVKLIQELKVKQKAEREQVEAASMKSKVVLVQRHQADFEQVLEKIMIGGSEHGRGTNYPRFKPTFEAKRNYENAEALRAKERFKEAVKYEKKAKKLDKAEEASWFEKYLHATVGDHPNSVIAQVLVKYQRSVEQHDRNLDVSNTSS